MALTVKSRRDRSASMAVEKTTSGFRDDAPYCSARCVVTSTRVVPRAAPMVPKRLPWDQTLSAQPARICSVREGRASVVKSRSPPALRRSSQEVADHPADQVETGPGGLEQAGQLVGCV